MSTTHTLGRFCLTLASQAQGAPLIDRGIAIEKDGRKRQADCIVIRTPFTKHRPSRALFLGLWRKQVAN